ncbi:MAG: extracellular solute-binding protein [Chloroflexi bacterium]|nr:extracellular solute-binding protein [Chloroflexota bacterium]
MNGSPGKMVRNLTLTGAVCAVLIFLSCTSPQAPAPAIKAPAQATVQQQGWEQDWQKTLAAARNESPLNIYSPTAAETRVEISKRFKDKYGLDIEWTALRASEIPTKVQAERRAGLYIGDLQMGSISSMATILKPAGVLEPIKPLLVLPEVLDKSLWFGGDISWGDNDKMYVINSLLGPNRKVLINTNMVKPSEIKSYNDFLDPRWKGKVVVINALLSRSLFTQLVLFTGGGDYWKKFAGNDPVIVDDDRQGVEWVARGRYPVMLIGNSDNASEFIRAGAPIQLMLTEEVALSGATISTGMYNRAPHPNAAKVFANWFMSKEGSTILSRITGVQSTRLDVPTDHLGPDQIRGPAAKYLVTENEEFYLRTAQDVDLIKEIFGADGRGIR